jgi:hypothetical protein
VNEKSPISSWHDTSLPFSCQLFFFAVFKYLVEVSCVWSSWRSLYFKLYFLSQSILIFTLYSMQPWIWPVGSGLYWSVICNRLLTSHSLSLLLWLCCTVVTSKQSPLGLSVVKIGCHLSHRRAMDLS